MENIENLVGKQVSFGVMAGTKAINGRGKIISINISPDMSTSSALGIRGENVTVPSQPGQGKVIGVTTVNAGGKRRKTLKKRKSKY